MKKDMVHQRKLKKALERKEKMMRENFFEIKRQELIKKYNLKPKKQEEVEEEAEENEDQ
jgi:hypothetical protein